MEKNPNGTNILMVCKEHCHGTLKQNLDGSFGATPIAAAGNNSNSDQESNQEAAETGNIGKRGFFANPAYDFVKKLYENYDSTFITMLAAQYIN